MLVIRPVEEIESLSIDELKSLLEESNLEESNKNTEQMGVKILMNAGYGAIGTNWLRDYYDLGIARAITACGELVNKWVTKAVNEELRRLSGLHDHKFVIYGDTDSIYITLDVFAEKFGWDKMDRDEEINAIDAFEKEYLQPFISKTCQDIADTVNAYEQRMFWGREVIALDGGIFQSKKHYAILVDDSEGVRYNHAKLKVVGLDSKKSSTPEICVPWLEKCYSLAIQNREEDMQAFIKACRQTYYEKSPEEIGSSSGVSNVQKYMLNGTNVAVKGAPYGSVAAILHNRIVTDNDYDVPLITDGAKVIIVTMTKQNPYNANYISFENYWPPVFEEKVRPWVDYQGMFTKAFEHPLQLLLNSVKMSTKKKVNLSSLFKKKEA